MAHLLLRLLTLASMSALGAAAINVCAQAGNTMEITIGSGPHAGTYQLSAANTTCLHTKQRRQFSAAYKDVNARDPHTLSGAGINIFNPDEAGPKQGQVNITFGDPDDSRPPLYVVIIPRDSTGPLTLTKSSTGVDVTFEGQTKDGVKLRVMARCGEIMEF